MIIWSGHGYVVAIIVFACSLITELVTESAAGNDQFYQSSSWALPLALAVAGGLTWVFQRVVLTRLESRNPECRHSLFFVPVGWWAPILGVIAVCVFAYRVSSGGG